MIKHDIKEQVEYNSHSMVIGVGEQGLVEPGGPLMLLMSVKNWIYAQILTCCCPVDVSMRLLGRSSILGASLSYNGGGPFN